MRSEDIIHLLGCREGLKLDFKRELYKIDSEDPDYEPEFIIRLKDEEENYLILETKGYDPLEEVKRAAAERWVSAVNADGHCGRWQYIVAKKNLRHQQAN